MNEDSVAWDNSYSVGFGPIDDQHKKLVFMTGELFESCKEGGDEARLAFSKAVRSALEYAKTHFAAEEDYLSRVSYPNLAAHKKEHFNFTFEIVDVLDKFEAGGAAPLEMARFLKKWLLEHIAKVDRDYAPFMAKLVK